MIRVLPPWPGDIVLIGDSLTQGADWNALLPGLPIRNFGISGDTTRDVCRRLDSILVSDPRTICLMIGTNDVTSAIPERETQTNLDDIVLRIVQHRPPVDLILHTILPASAPIR